MTLSEIIASGFCIGVLIGSAFVIAATMLGSASDEKPTSTTLYRRDEDEYTEVGEIRD